MPILGEILEWVNENTRPNNRYKYSRCVICRNAWWDNQEQHSYDCWVPRLKSEVRARPGESVSPIPPELEHNGERTDCLVVGPRPPSAASPQQVAAGKQGNE